MKVILLADCQMFVVMKRVIIVLVCAVATATAFPQKWPIGRRLHETPKVIGGQDAQRNQFPYQAEIRLNINGNISHLCGGTIISTLWILTAAHCHLVIDNVYDVALGILNQKENHPDVQIIGVEDWIDHPDFPGGANFGAHDISVIKLKQAARITAAVQIAPLPEDRDCNVLESAYLSGWGNSTWSGIEPTHLQWALVPRISQQQCKDDIDAAWGEPGDLHETMLCTGQNEGIVQSLCAGDSGGPLVLASNGRVIGVVSWSLYPCGAKNAPSVYTNVCSHMDFITYYVK